MTKRAAVEVRNGILAALLATRAVPSPPEKAIVRLPGGAMRMRSKDPRKEVRFGSPLKRLLLDYKRRFLAAISQSVACSEPHRLVADRRHSRA